MEKLLNLGNLTRRLSKAKTKLKFNELDRKGLRLMIEINFGNYCLGNFSGDKVCAVFKQLALELYFWWDTGRSSCREIVLCSGQFLQGLSASQSFSLQNHESVAKVLLGPRFNSKISGHVFTHLKSWGRRGMSQGLALHNVTN